MGNSTKREFITGGVFITAIVVLLGLSVMVKNTPVGVQEGTQPVVASTFQEQDEDCD